MATVALVIAPGCAEELGPERLPTAVVEGKLRAGAQTIGPGWVEFLPVEGTVGNLRSAPIARDGTFLAEGVAVGVNQVGLVVPGDRALSQRFHPLGSPVRRTIPPGRSTLSIDFLHESLRAPARP